MGGLPPRRSDEEKLVRVAESAVEGEAHRVEVVEATRQTRRANEALDELDRIRPRLIELTAQRDAARAQLAQIAEFIDGIHLWNRSANIDTIHRMAKGES